MSAETHECVFVEESEPSGRLILTPCLTCGLTGLDALEQRDKELTLAHTTGDQMAHEIVQAFKLLGLDEPDADDHLPTVLAKRLHDLRNVVMQEAAGIAFKRKAGYETGIDLIAAANEPINTPPQIDEPNTSGASL